MLFPAQMAQSFLRWSGKLLLLTVLVVGGSAGSVFAQAGHLTPAQEAWLRQIYMGKTTVWDTAYINGANWTNFLATHTNTLFDLLSSGITNVVPVLGTNFDASVTGHTAYITFDNTLPAWVTAHTNELSEGIANMGIWGTYKPGGLTPLKDSLAYFAGVWQITSTDDITPATNPVPDTLWKLNAGGDIIPR